MKSPWPALPAGAKPTATTARKQAAYELQQLVHLLRDSNADICNRCRTPLDIPIILRDLPINMKKHATWSRPRPIFAAAAATPKPDNKPDPSGECINLMCQLACIAALKDFANAHPDQSVSAHPPLTLLEQALHDMRTATNLSGSHTTLLQHLLTSEGQEAAVRTYWPGRSLDERTQGRGCFLFPPGSDVAFSLLCACNGATSISLKEVQE